MKCYQLLLVLKIQTESKISALYLHIDILIFISRYPIIHYLSHEKKDWITSSFFNQI